MHRILITVFAALLGFAEGANVAAAELFSKTGPVIAIMANDLFLDEAEGHLSGAGTIAIRSQRSPDVACVGQFTSSAELGGSGEMRCSNGATGTYHFKRLSLEKGYGVGSYRRRAMSFTYGLTADESEPYLKLPAGKRLERKGNTLALVDIPRTPARIRAATGGRRTEPSH